VSAATHVAPALLRVLDRLHDTPALILSSLGETLVQNRMAAALLGDKSGYTGLARSEIYRWFTNPAERLRYPADDRDRQSRAQVANLRAAYALIHFRPRTRPTARPGRPGSRGRNGAGRSRCSSPRAWWRRPAT